MKETVNISLRGRAFIFEKDAYTMLDSYLRNISGRISIENGRDEIMNDIETRISELLSQRVSEPNYAVNRDMISDVMTTIGSPHHFGESKNSYTFNIPRMPRRRWMRDSSKAVLGGVCAGTASYLRTSIVLIRVVLVLLLFFYGFGVLPYIILWIALPSATTAEERRMMQEGHEQAN